VNNFPLIFVAASLLLLNAACTSQPEQPADKPSLTTNQTEQSTNPTQALSSRVYVVQKGDTLYSIARRHNMSVQQLAQLNRLRAPYSIYPGQRLNLVASATSTPPPAAQRRPGGPPLKQVARGQTGQKVTAPAAPRNSQCAPPVQWYYPTQGAVSPHVTPAGRRGILISGRVGQPIKAAAPGTVIYSGNAMQGYRNLIIIQHNQAFLSVYANNQQRWVQDNARVYAGQTIATMGLDNNNRPALHFEIRCQGKAVDPLLYLPNL